MKGSPKVLKTLNDLLSDELTAISQYMVHSEMCANWGYERLHEAVERRAMVEMKHAEKLIARIIFLSGTPVVNKLGKMSIGGDVVTQLRHDLESEQGAVRVYNEAILQAEAEADNGSREMMERILKDEEGHLDWIETQLDQVKQMGIQNYLLHQVEKGDASA